MTHPNESLSHLNGDAGVAQVGDNETRTFIEAVQLIEDAGWVVLRPEQVASRTRNMEVGVKTLINQILDLSKDAAKDGDLHFNSGLAAAANVLRSALDQLGKEG